MFTIEDVEILEHEPCYQGFLSVSRIRLRHRLFQGGWSSEITREMMSRARGVGVLLYDPDLDKVLLVEQFRVGCLEDPNGPWALELVAGIVESGQSNEEVAIREVQEEADIIISRLIPVCEYYNSPGGSSEKLSIYCARFDANNMEGVFGLIEEMEDIRTVILNRKDAEASLIDGKINNAMSIIALQWLSLNIENVTKALA